MRRATRLTHSASATDEPPYFCTTRPTGAPARRRFSAKRQGTGEPGSLPRHTYPDRMPRRPLALVVLLVAGLTLAACGADPAPSAADEAQVRAQAGLLQSYNATYTVKDASGADGQRVTVWRTPTTLRLDVKTAGGVSTSITTPERTVACQAPENGKAPTCLVVA